MATRRKGLSALERDLLQVAAERRSGGVWLRPDTLETMAQTHRALLRLEKLELLERKGKDALRWRITKAGRAELGGMKA